MAENDILNNSYVIGVGSRNLVLNTLGRVYVRVQEKYYELNFKDSISGGGAGYGGVIIVNTNAEATSIKYPGDNILILSKEGNMYYTQNGVINLFGLGVDSLIDPTITGTLTINNGDKVPIIVQNPLLCPGLNAELLNGYTYDKFALKEESETITGDWTFSGNNIIEQMLYNEDSNTTLDFENSRLVIDYIDVRKGITGIDIVFPEPLIELDENDHITPVDENYGFYTQQFVSCRGLDVEAAGSIGYATEAFVRQAVADLVNGAPTTLDTLGEIAAMLSDNDNLLDALNQLVTVHSSELERLSSYFEGDAAKKAIQLRDTRKLWGNDFNGTQDVNGTLFFNNNAQLVPTNLGHLYTNTGFYSDSFVSCRGLDPSADAGSGGGMDRQVMFDILRNAPANSQEYINLKYLDLSAYDTKDNIAATYASKTLLNTELSYKANNAVTITAGNGLTGGGNLEANRTITLGTPGTITNSSTNSASSESHTHNIDKASTSVVGIVKLYDGVDSTSTTLALTANQGRLIDGRLDALEAMWENKGDYLLAKSNRGIVSNTFISCKGLDVSAPSGSSIAILSSNNLANNFNDANTSSTFNAYTIKSLANRITELENGGTSGGITQESDPVFKASAAYTITYANINSWNGKWTYSENTIKNVKVNNAGYADSAGSAVDQTARNSASNAQTTANGKWTYNAETIKGVKVNNAGYADSAGAVAWNNVSGKPSTFPPDSHSHDYLSIYGGTVSGNLTVTGSFTWGSDIRYKNVIKDVHISLDVIANAPFFNYIWKNREDQRECLGTSAQYWYTTAFKNAVLPTTDDSLWTMSYAEIALGNTISIAQELLPIKSDVFELKDRVSNIEKRLGYGDN